MARNPSSNGKNGNGAATHNGNGNGKAPVAGQDPKTGKFVPGNQLGVGSTPYAEKKRKFQHILLKTTTPQRMGKIVQAFLRQAERGEHWAVKEFFERFLGKVKDEVDINATVTLADILTQLREDRLGRFTRN